MKRTGVVSTGIGLLTLALLTHGNVIHAAAVNPPGSPYPGMTHFVLNSAAVGYPIGYNVWVPNNYDNSGNQKYSVLFFLHGAGGNESQDAPGVAFTVQGAMNAGTFPPAILVFPNGELSGYQGGHEQMIINELIPWVDSHYPTYGTADTRATLGFSMGGAGSMYLSLKHANTFGAAVSWGGSNNGNNIANATANAAILKANDYGARMFNGDGDNPTAFVSLNDTLTSLGIDSQRIVLPNLTHNYGQYGGKAYGDTLVFLADKLLPQPVPEPAAIALVAVPSLAWALRRRRTSRGGHTLGSWHCC